MPSGIITLTSDFGLGDPYVSVMKGVILSINPHARLIDVSHQLKAGSILEASALIQEVYPFFPEGTVHLVIVDPGVGTKRRPVVVATQVHLFVGPDNGLFWPIIETFEPVRIVQLTERKYFLPQVSQTFHGRDIFAPVSAYLSLGVDPMKMGLTVDDPVRLEVPSAREENGVFRGQVIRVDCFGSLITNIRRKDLERFLGSARPVIRIGKLIVEGVLRTYAEVRAGETLALFGSSDRLEIAVNLGRACERVGIDSEEIVGTQVEVRRL